jgi:hypothetical protein
MNVEDVAMAMCYNSNYYLPYMTQATKFNSCIRGVHGSNISWDINDFDRDFS